MTAKKNNKIDLMIKELGEALKFENEEERIELKASFIQLEILEEIDKLMKGKNITRTELAGKLKKSKSFVSQLFSGDKALNLKMIAQFQEIFNAKFIPSFKDYSEYLKTKDIGKEAYIKNIEEKGWVHAKPSFDLKKYQLEKRKENKAA